LIAGLGLAVLVVILSWPVNYYVRAPLVLMPANAERVYSKIDGALSAALPAGRRVAAGETVATLKNSTVDIELARLEGEQQVQMLRVDHLQRLRSVDPEASTKLPTARAALADLDERLTERRRDAQRLTLAAPADGVVIPAPRAAATHAGENQLPKWSGAILDEKNQGAWVEPGTLVCFVGDPAQLMAVLLVEDTDASRLQPGQTVRLRLDERPGDVLDGEVVEVAGRDVRDELNSTSGGDLNDLFAGLVPPGKNRPHYHVRVTINSAGQPLAIGGRGTAKVATERVTLARRMLRYLGHAFRLPM
jgi:hypothetical protein